MHNLIRGKWYYHDKTDDRCAINKWGHLLVKMRTQLSLYDEKAQAAR